MGSSHIDVPERLGPSETAAWLGAWRTALDLPVLSIQGLAASWVEPAGIVALAAGCARRREAGLPTEVVVDAPSKTGEYLRRMDFYRVLGIPDPAPSPRRPADGRFVELRALDSEAAAHEVAIACEALLKTQLPALASSLRRFARNVIEELGVNVVQHSGAPRTGFAMAQAWGGDAPRLQIAAADCGVGFLASLQRNLEFAGRVHDDADALQIALTKGVTGTDGASNSGFGLEMLRSLADVLAADLRLVSGGAMLHRRTVAGQRTNTVRSVGPWSGSWIVLDAPLKNVPPTAS